MDTKTPTTELGGLRGLLDQLAALHAAGEPVVLGIVVATQGSTYQKAGALVLLDRVGLRFGVISGGCLEPELEERARAVFATRRAALAVFDTRSDDDRVFGSGTGCRGSVELLLLPLAPQAPLATSLLSLAARTRAIDLHLATRAGELGAGSATCIDRAHAAAVDVHWDGAGAISATKPATDFVAHVVGPAQILLLGAGPESAPLTAFAHRLGWRVTLAEHRGRWLAFARAVVPDEIIERAPRAAIEALSQRNFDAIVIMSHNYAIDCDYLCYCASTRTGYVGLLGPPARRDELLAELGSDALALRGRLHSPVGLDLGGSGPEAIALAVAAELQRYLARARHA